MGTQLTVCSFENMKVFRNLSYQDSHNYFVGVSCHIPGVWVCVCVCVCKYSADLPNWISISVYEIG